jgi:predicted nucleotidyltransferase
MFKDLIASKTRRAVLGTFFMNPNKEYYIRQLAKMHNISAGTLHRELSRLEQAGIINSKRVGNIKLFSVNRQHPVYSDMGNIISKTEGIEKLLKDVVNNVSNIEIAFIYGSFAKDEEKDDSDIDLFLMGDDIDEDTLVVKVSELERKIFRDVNYTLYTTKSYSEEKRKKNSFILEVIKGKKIMLKGTNDNL